MPSRDPGAARERTDLAWQRAAFSYVALGAIVLGIAAHHDAPWLIAVSAGLVAVAGVVWRRGRSAYRRADVAAQPRVLAVLSVATAATALLAAAVVIVRL